MAGCWCLVVAGVRHGRRGLWSTCVTVLIVFCGILRVHQSTLDPAPDVTNRDVTVFSGIVQTAPERRPKGSRVGIALRSAAGIPARGTVLVQFRDFVPDLRPGDRERVDTSLENPSPPRNAGAFDYARYLRRRGIDRIARVRRPSQIAVLESSQGGAYSARSIGAMRRHIRACIRRHLSEDPAAVLQGVLLGDRSDLAEEVRSAFTRAGVAHVLAV